MSTAHTLPPLFVSHGSPMIALEPGATGAFFTRLGRTLDASFGCPRAILAVSAHTAARRPVLLAAPRHHTVHDFGGFSDALYRLRYDAPGAPALAAEVARCLTAAGVGVEVQDAGGLDHGIWTALMHLWPEPEVPVLPLSLVADAAPDAQFAIGAALAPLAETGVLVLGTGSITHNLRLLSWGAGEGGPERPESAAFRHWVYERGQARDWDALFDYRRQAPHAALMHPTDEHWLPFYVPAGAGGRAHAPVRLHDAVTLGALGMDAYAFGPHAARLHEALELG
ncbi:dioxygenase [Caldimonas brevitalea]|uniref:Extradiol ring-cleavage dioxygenase n=1 Tax=Caldimonas brevitalea TaxID=413882 RepID=A0A0G3BF34_9BURK|nr:class III extradiol ring-cleavage dioxygenase [Caldimonas brevitalea]AKJ28039.1 extradiol ring-cleavage dioxygenase [Caldimonas brevitalea]